MSDPQEIPAIPFNRRLSDDPQHRLLVYAEKRAARNGLPEKEQHRAGRRALALRRLMIEMGREPNTETILRVVSGEYLRA